MNAARPHEKHLHLVVEHREADLRLLVLAGLQLDAYGTEDGLTPAERIAAANDAARLDLPIADL